MKFKDGIYQEVIDLKVPDGYEFINNCQLVGGFYYIICGNEKEEVYENYIELDHKLGDIRGFVEKRFIPNVPETYKAGSDGEIYSRGQNGKKWDKVLANGTTRDGNYFNVQLYMGKKFTIRNVHRLICTAFYGLPQGEKQFTRHLDGNNKNNRADNLLFGTIAENYRDSIFHGTNNSGEKNGLSKISNIEREYTRFTYSQSWYSQRELSKLLNVSQACIFNAVHDKTIKVDSIDKNGVYKPPKAQLLSQEIKDNKLIQTWGEV